MKDRQSISRSLQASLSTIATQLKNTQSARGAWVKKERQDGYDMEWVPDPPDDLGLNKVTFINVQVHLWRELGSILERLAKGEDARRLFGQHLRTKPSKDGEHRVRALAYWSVRARDPKASDARALELARKVVPIVKELKRDTLRKYAQRHRMRCLCVLALHPNWVFRFEASDVQIRALGPGIAPLVTYLRKKESREKWRKPALFKTAFDMFYVKSRGRGERDPAFAGLSLHAEELPPIRPFTIERRDATLERISVTYPKAKRAE